MGVTDQICESYCPNRKTTKKINQTNSNAFSTNWNVILASSYDMGPKECRRFSKKKPEISAEELKRRREELISQKKNAKEWKACQLGSLLVEDKKFSVKLQQLREIIALSSQDNLSPIEQQRKDAKTFARVVLGLNLEDQSDLIKEVAATTEEDYWSRSTSTTFPTKAVLVRGGESTAQQQQAQEDEDLRCAKVFAHTPTVVTAKVADNAVVEEEDHYVVTQTIKVKPLRNGKMPYLRSTIEVGNESDK